MKITIISSSTRIGRVSHRVALALEKQIRRAGHQAEVIDLAELNLPPFEARYSSLGNKPESWIRTMNSLVESDGLIFLTPEYNGTFSSGLKNFIDVFSKEGFTGKPIGVATGSAGAMGGVRAVHQLQHVILSLGAYPQPQTLMVGEMKKKFDETGELIDDAFKNRFENFVNSFLDFSAKLSNRSNMKWMISSTVRANRQEPELIKS